MEEEDKVEKEKVEEKAPAAKKRAGRPPGSKK